MEVNNSKEKQFQNRLNSFILDENVKSITNKIELLPLWSLSLGYVAYFLQDWWFIKRMNIKIGIWKKIGIVTCGAIFGLQLGIIEIKRTMKNLDPKGTIIMQLKDIMKELQELKKEKQDEKYF